MPRKTVERPGDLAAAAEASMRPRPDAAENRRVGLSVVGELRQLQ